MGRYSPTVEPNYGPSFGEAIAHAFDSYFTAKRQRRQDQQATDAQDAEFAGHGIFRGHAPTESPTTLRIPDIPSFTPDLSQGLTQALRGGSPATPPQQPFAAPPGPELARAFRGPPATGREANANNGGPGLSMPAVGADGRDHAALHPGAFDPTTRSFGGSPQQRAALTGAPGADGGRAVTLPPAGRYQQINDRMYVDQLQTPPAIAERARMEEMEFNKRLALELQNTDPYRQAQIRDLDAKTAKDRQAAAANERAHGALRAMGHPAAADDFNPGVDYSGALKEAQGEQSRHAQFKQRALGDFNALRAEFPNDALAKKPFDENTDYTAAVAAARQQRSSVTTAEHSQQKLMQVDDGKGGTVWAPASQAAGMHAPKKASATLPAPMAAKVGQFGEMLKKADDLLPLMDALEVSLGQSASNDIAERGFGHIPGTRGLGSMLVNRSPQYAKYQAALDPFILAAAHALSGARINQDQVTQIRKSVEIKPGESKESRDQKRKNLVDLFNSIGGALPRDAIAAQEAQMEPVAMQRLAGYGYRPNDGSTPPATASASSAGKTPPPQSQDEYNHLITSGMTDAQIVARYGQPATSIKRKR